jgi:uncharacterized protein (DUF2252 family)
VTFKSYHPPTFFAGSYVIENTESVKDRLQYGRNLRSKLRRSDHAKWDVSKRRHDPIEIILQLNQERIPELIPIKMARMAVSPFGFFRGNVAVMAADLSTLPRAGIAVQICGDAHVRNLGAYSAPDGRLVFDINDFDETIRAPWEWDVRRLATSLVLAGREAGDSDRRSRDAVLACAAIYRAKLQEFSRMTCIGVHKYRTHRQFLGRTGSSVLQRAVRETPDRTLAKLTLGQGSMRRFKSVPPILRRVGKPVAGQVLNFLQSYQRSLSECSQQVLRFYRPVDVAFKVVGTGSVGTYDFVVLEFAGDGTRDPLFLQVKQALPFAYSPYVRSSESAIHQGKRVVLGQRLFEVQSDMMLGWTSLEGREFLVRQLKDHKASIRGDELMGAGLIEYATTCGEVLAKGHARSGDAAVLAGYLGSNDRWDKALAKFSLIYADQTTRDYEMFRKAIKQGKIKAGNPYL